MLHIKKKNENHTWVQYGICKRVCNKYLLISRIEYTVRVIFRDVYKFTCTWCKKYPNSSYRCTCDAAKTHDVGEEIDYQTLILLRRVTTRYFSACICLKLGIHEAEFEAHRSHVYALIVTRMIINLESVRDSVYYLRVRYGSVNWISISHSRVHLQLWNVAILRCTMNRDINLHRCNFAEN